MCDKTYTPTDAVEALFSHYVMQGGFPAVDETGRKLYHMGGHGCAVQVLASPAMRKMLALTDHHVSPACSLSSGEIDLVEIIDAPGWCAGTISNFVQSIQDSHDAAADDFRASIDAGSSDGLAHDIFCGRLVRELANVCNEFELSGLARDLKLRARPKRHDSTPEDLRRAAPKFTDSGELVRGEELVSA